MSLDLRSLRRALRGQLVTITDFPLLSNGKRALASQNRHFKPPEPPSIWIREQLIVGAEPKVATKAVQSTGIVQYDVVFPHNDGTGDAEDLAGRIADAFEPGSSIVSLGLEISIDRAERGSLRQFERGVWEAIAVSVFWRVYTFTTV